MNVHFAQPAWLIAGVFVCLFLLFYLRIAAARRQKTLARLVAPKISRKLTANVSVFRRRIKNILLLLAVVGCFIALSGPRYGEQWIDVKQKGIDILFGLDASRSMLARDIQPDRLQRAKFAIKDFVALLNGDRIGLMPFAGTSYLMCPLTTDYSAFNASLDAVDPASVPVGGTNLAEVIKKAGKVLAGEANHKILILVTDGEDLQGEAIQAAKEAAQQKMTIYTVGVGTRAGDLIPDANSDGSFVKDSSGNFIRSRLDEKTLKKIAEITGGLYVPLGNMGQGFTTIYQQKLKLAPKEVHQERKQKRPIERFYWPLAFAILLFVADFLLTGRKSSWTFGAPLIKTAGRRIFKQKKLLIVLCLLIIKPLSANGSTAEQLFHEGKLDQAEKKYTTALKKQPKNSMLLFNLGDVQYKKKDYAQAATSFTNALGTDNLKLQAKTYYNLGNTQYQQGRLTLKTDPEQTIDQYKKAVQSYKGCLKLTPDDSDAEANLSLVKKQLQALEQQQNKKKEQQQKSKKKEQKEKEKKKSGQKNKQGKGNTQKKNNANKNGQGRQSPADKKRSAQDNKQAAKKKTGENGKTTKKDKKHAGSNTDKSARRPGAGNSIEPRTTQKKQGSAAGISKEDASRRKQGKMTKKEAANLLDALKSEEGRLEYIPAQHNSESGPTKGDW